MLESAAKALAVAAAILLILSTAFDFSYLYALGLAFEEVPTTLADHVRSALIWAPKAAVYGLGFAIYEMTMRRLERNQTEEELIRRSQNPGFTRWFRRSPAYLFAGIAAVYVLTNTLLTNASHGIYLSTIVAWGVLSGWLVVQPRTGKQLSKTIRLLFVVFPLIGIWVGYLGYAQGRSVLDATAPMWSVVLKSEGTTQSQQLRGIRRFSTIAVLVSVDGKVSIIPNDSILTASLVQSPIAGPHRLCRLLSIACESKPPAK